MVYQYIHRYLASGFGFWIQCLTFFQGQRGKLTLLGFWRTLCSGSKTFMRYCWWVVALVLCLNLAFLYGVNHTTTLYVRMATNVLATALLVYVYNFFIVPCIVASVRCAMQRKDADYFKKFGYLGLLSTVCAVLYAAVPPQLFLLLSPATLVVALIVPDSYLVDLIMPVTVFFTWYVCSMFFYADAAPKKLFASMWHGLTMMLVNHPILFIVQWPFLGLLYIIGRYVPVYEAGNAYSLLLLYYIPATCLFVVYSCLIQVFYIQFRHTQKELYDAE